MVWIILLTILTFGITLFSGSISDDITVNCALKKLGYPIRWKEHLRCNPFMIIHDLFWKIGKDNWAIQHLINLITYVAVVCLFYLVGLKFLPQPIAFLACLFFIVHPCNCQVAGWISGRGYMQATLIGLLALLFNNPLIYLISAFCHPVMLGAPLLMNIPWWAKGLSILLFLHFALWAVGKKVGQSNTEGWFKRDNMKLYPRKIVVAVKSYCYYLSLAFFPIKMGWFHEFGEPITKDTKSLNRHFWLCLALLGSLCLLHSHPAFRGIIVFTLFIIPFTNLITPALFTSERYMTPALMGWSIFLAYMTIDYPIVAAIIVTAYFMRTQLELWAYKDDFRLALYSVLNFQNSGFAWCNMANMFLHSCKPSAAYDILMEIQRRLPTFPTTYYQLYLMHRAVDLLNDYGKALMYLEKACYYGKHESWFKELESFRVQLKQLRLQRFKENVTRNQTPRQFRPPTEADIQNIEPALVGAFASN